MLDSLYGQVMRVRRRRYERQPHLQRRLSRPVISVGNLSMGGTGKTPVVAALAQHLAAAGERPAILSRGYKRADPVDGVVIVTALDRKSFSTDIKRAGDEPMMLARASGAPVFVSPDRYLAGRLAEQRGCTVHLLDDGFQHLELARDFDILVTRVGEIPGGRVIPFGRLREPIDAAARADFVVVSDATEAEAAAEAARLGIAASCGMARALSAPVSVHDPDAPTPPSTSKVLAVAGIAHPERFTASLTAAGWQVADAMAFADHHRYGANDLAAIAQRRVSAGADVVFTTAKDAVRFEAIDPAPFPLYCTPLVVTFDPPRQPYDAVMAVLR